MGFRLQRRIAIAKGVHLNLSKSGIGMSAGPRGFGVSTGPRGSLVHAGIPGSGLSYRAGIGTRSASKSSASSGIGAYSVALDEQRRVRIVAPAGERLDDNDIEAKRIKRTEEYKQAARKLTAQAVELVSENTSRITDIFKSTPTLITKEELQESLKRSPEVYERKQFGVQYPTAEWCVGLLTTRPSLINQLKWSLSSRSKAAYLEKNVPERLSEEIAIWNRLKAEFDAEQQLYFDAAQKANAQLEAEKQETTQRLKDEKGFIVDMVAKLYGEITLPVQFSVDAGYGEGKHAVYLDIDLPEIETMPREKASELSSGKLSVKEKTSKELNADYCRCVIGMAFYLSGLAFNVSTEIERVIASGYTQRTSRKTGQLQDEYVYSVNFDRTQFSNLNFAEIEPAEAFENFEHRCNISSTFELKTIEPFEVEG